MKKSLMIALAAGAAASAAFGQDLVPANEVNIQKMFVDANGNFHMGTMPTSRAALPVYEPGNTVPNTFVTQSRLIGYSHVGDDITYGGPWAGGPPAAPNNNLSVVGFGCTRAATPAALPTGADFFMRFWEDADLTASPMINTGTGNNFQTIFGGNIGAQLNAVAPAGYYELTFTTLTFPAPVGDSTIFVESEWRGGGGTATAPNPLLPGPTITGTALTANHPYQFWSWVGNTPSVGSTSDGYAHDANNDGIFQGGPAVTLDTAAAANPSTAEHRINRLALPQGPSPIRINYFMSGEIPPAPPPTADVDLTANCLDDGQTTVTGTLAGGSADARNDTFWVKVCLDNDVTDAALAYLDIDTEGSGTFNTYVAMYDNSGNFLLGPNSDAGLDEADGSGDLAQLSFGAGNRAANGDGNTFNGTDGELAAIDGPFWIGVASEPLAGAVGEGFNLLSDPTAAGLSVTVNIRTNVNDPITNTYTPVPPTSVELIPPGGAAGDPVYGDIDFTEVNPGDPGVVWLTFVTCKELELNDPDTTDYLDIDFGDSGLDPEGFLFDSNGVLVATSDDDGSGTLPLLSFGNSSAPRADYTTPADPTETYAGQNGALPQGRYYLAIAFFDATTLPSNDRWFVRPESPNDDIALGADLHSGNSAGDCSVGCDTIDFNGDGLFPDNQDIQDFFDVFGGGNCSTGTCNDIDFNNDGLFPDNTDLEAYLRVFGGGSCAG